MRSIILSISAISILLSMHCGFSSHDEVILVHSNDPVILQATENARDEWNACHKQQLFLTQDETYPGAIPLDILPAGEHLEYDGEERSALTYFDAFDRPTKIHVETVGNPAFYQAIIAHEFGHVLTGPLHHGNGLMSGGLITTPDVYVTSYECSFFKE